MNCRIIVAVAVSATMVTGCVSTVSYTKALTELKESRKARAGTSEAFEHYQKEATAEIEALHETIRAKEQAFAQRISVRLTWLRQRGDELQAQFQQQAEQLKAVQAEKSRLEQERAAKDSNMKILTQSRAALSESLEAQDAERKRLEEERAAMEAEIQHLTETHAALIKSLLSESEAQDAERKRLEEERAAMEAEIQHLTETHAALVKSLEAELAKGGIWIKRVRDRLSITMVDRLLFDSGRAQVKPDGLKVLKRVSDILKHVRDKQIRIEGHTDNVPIGTQLRNRFPTNWELSTARASSVVRYLIEQGGMNRASLSAIGYAENRPVASNDGEKGRAANRRIEIVLYPKDLTQVVSQINP